MTTLHDIQTTVHVAKNKAANGSLAKWISENARHKGESCLLWPYSIHKSTGYPGNTSWEGRQMFGHRAMCFAAHGAPPSKSHHAAHKCGNRWCINPNHLRWATCQENQMDRIEHGTSNQGAKHGSAKLTPIEVAAIITTKTPARQISDMFGVHRRTVSDIRNGKTWKVMR